MSRSLQTASLSDNVVNIPIRLYTARRLGPYRFHLLHQKDGSRVRQHLLRRTLNPVKTLLHALLVVMLISCSRIPVASTQPVRIDGAIDGRRIEHVVIIAIDGLKRDTLLQYLMTSPPRREGGLHDLLGAKQDGDGLVLTKGVSVKEAVTVFPSYTYPSWTSMFTGVFPGVHGITGNSVFFRDRKVARYYAEYHLDALRAQMEKDFLSNDINPNTKTIYEYVGEQGGQSIVVHNMVSRGAEARKPDFDTLWNYQRNHSKKVDENSLWATIKSLEEFNKDDPAEQRLPTVLTMYFSGLDHAEHMLSTDPEKARLAYLKDIDDLIAKFIVGSPAIARNHFPTPESDSIQTDFVSWPGLQTNPAWARTLVILVSDHGHTPIKWNDALGMEDLKLMVKELNKKNGRTYNLEDPTLIDESLWSKIRAGVGFFVPDGVSPLSNIVATFNGGALGLHIKPAEGSWKQRPDYTTDIVPVLEHVLLTLHRNDQEPEAVLYNTGNRYVSVPYESTRSAVRVRLSHGCRKTDGTGLKTPD